MAKSKALVESAPQSNLAPVTRADVEALKAQRDLLREFVSSQLKEANFEDSKALDYGDGDFGVIPGTKKKVLLKPGAEKLMQLFNYGVRFRAVEKMVERESNFALFEYEAEVYHRKSGTVVATCIGTANSQEKKWRTRTVYTNKIVNGKSVRASHEEETPIFDVLNTLSKMAQKRALVGATILATAASDYFTQDLEDETTQHHGTTVEKDVTPAADMNPKAQPASQEAPTCCGRPMMLSKFPNRETGAIDWYCIKCRTSVPQGEVA